MYKNKLFLKTVQKRGYDFHHNPLKLLVELEGIEPTTS